MQFACLIRCYAPWCMSVYIQVVYVYANDVRLDYASFTHSIYASAIRHTNIKISEGATNNSGSAVILTPHLQERRFVYMNCVYEHFQDTY